MTALILLAYLEEDGLLLSIALLVAIIAIAVALATVWAMVLGANLISSLWWRAVEPQYVVLG